MSRLSNEFSWDMVLQAAMKQSAKDCGCTPEDFLKSENTILLPSKFCGAKKCYTQPHFFQLTSYGNGTVAVVNEQVSDFAKKYLDSCQYPFYAFDTPHIIQLSKKMAEYRQSVCFLAEFFLPDPKSEVTFVSGLDIRFFSGREIASLYGDKRFSMALSYTVTADKKDVIAAVGYMDGQLAGIAGASDDCDTMWQIGIDVLPAFRQKGIASALTSRLSQEIFRHGKIPFYCTAWSNLASKKNAVASGYKNAWVELSVKEDSMVKKLLG